ncbi:structural protein P5 [Parabacteroides sp. OttesenSCG-928-K15]|nr:structural protein P5 [Parabacteroides sp. OttesenSCG-928-K15]
MLPRGLRNNNPGNIRHNKDKFQGEVVPSKDAAFKQFTSMAYGYRAMFVTLGTYLMRDRRDTIEKIITAWAPASENNTEGYIAQVERLSGVRRDKRLTPASGTDYIKIVAAMSRVENGQAADLLEVEDGFDLQAKITR